MTTQAQVIAIERNVKSQTYNEISELDKLLSKGQLLSGLSRTYRPKDEDGDTMPDERTPVQVNAQEVLDRVQAITTKAFDVAAMREWGNTHVKGTVTIDGVELLADVPVNYLLYLEKQLGDLETLIARLPALDPAELWEHDDNAGVWRTAATETTRSKKVLRNHLKYEATPQHPAQVETYAEDVIVGYYALVKYSGALPPQRIADMVSRVRQLIEAVKFAREAANTTTIEKHEVGKVVLDWIFR